MISSTIAAAGSSSTSERNHYQIASKTYYLETVLGWSGLAVEPQKEFAADYVEVPARTRFFPLFVSSTSDETAKLFVLKDQSSVASSNEAVRSAVWRS